MEPVTVALIGDDETALKLEAKLRGIDPSMVIVVGGHYPEHHMRPFQSDPLEWIYPNANVPLIINPYHAKPEPLAVSEKVLALLKRAA